MEAPASTSVASTPPDGARRFGTFAGVFTPSILTILGVVMYLRFGWVTGNAGLGGTLLIVGVSHLITFSTGLSIASIATNRTMGAGGAYFMVSRSLGASAGAAIGIPLFFGQALSVTFYIVGFTEAVVQLVPWLPARATSTAVNVIITALSWKSAELAIRAQYFVMAAIVLSLVSFFAGHGAHPPAAIDWSAPADAAPFSTVFAVFFPAVTGIMAGVSMSGDLRDPRKAMPRGTLLAVATGLIIYTAVPIWLARNASGAELRAHYDAMWRIALVPALVYLGVWGATLSSALGSVLGAPRTLQALAIDGLAPRIFARGSGPTNEPRLGTALTFVIAETGILLGSLDVIAPILTMFFLATYGFTNLACGLEKWAASPSFRPSFRVPAGVSLAGALGCFYVMSIIDLPAMIAAVVISGAIYLYIQRRTLGTTYGDARHGIWAALVRSALHRLRRTEWHAQNWRPNLIILGGNPADRPQLIELGSALVQDSGIVTYFYLLKGTVAAEAARRQELLAEVEARLARDFPNVFCRVDIVDDIYRGVVAVSQSYGVGTFEANSVMLGWLQKPERAEAYVQMLRELSVLGRSVLLVRQGARGFGNRARIHVWWGGLAENGGLMLLLALLLRSHHSWRRATVTLLTVIDHEGAREQAEAAMHRILADARLDADVRVISRADRSIPEVMRAESAAADLAIIGMRLPEPGEAAENFLERNRALLEELPTTILVHGARHLESEVVLFDQPTSPSGPPATAAPPPPEAAGG